MQNSNLHISLERLHNLTRIQPQIIGPFQGFLARILRDVLPQETVMITLESHSLPNKICEIVALVSEDPRHLGRQEKYDKCVYSQFSDVLNRVVILEKAKEQPGYLSLDDRVMSEIFFEYTFTESLHLILNAEFSSVCISGEVNEWFGSMCGIFLGEKKNIKNSS